MEALDGCTKGPRCKTLNSLVDPISKFFITFSALSGAHPELPMLYTICKWWMGTIVLCEWRILLTTSTKLLHYRHQKSGQTIFPMISIVNKWMYNRGRCPMRHTCSEPTTSESSGTKFKWTNYKLGFPWLSVWLTGAGITNYFQSCQWSGTLYSNMIIS